MVLPGGCRRSFVAAVTAVAAATTTACWPQALIMSTDGGGGVAAIRGTRHCTVGAGSEPATASPAEVQLDPGGVTTAVEFATVQLAASVRIYRHGCLVALSSRDPDTQWTPANLWSATKGVVSILAGRAAEIGALGIDDPIGRHLPQADPTHGAITVRELLTQTSGLRFAWLNEANPALTDSVAYTLGLPFAHPPGTYFEYAQATVTLLGRVIEAATGRDLQEFARDELFRPLGIPDGRWYWTRDAAGHTLGYAYLSMAPADLARLGALLLGGGSWEGRRLLAEDYMSDVSRPTSTNPGYGFLMWTNRGEWHYTPSALVRQKRDHRWIRSAPEDLYALSGMGDQLVEVIPSLDMVVVRTGLPGWEGWHHEFFRYLMRAVRDVAVEDPGGFVGDMPPEWDTRAVIDLETWPR